MHAILNMFLRILPCLLLFFCSICCTAKYNTEQPVSSDSLILLDKKGDSISLHKGVKVRMLSSMGEIRGTIEHISKDSMTLQVEDVFVHIPFDAISTIHTDHVKGWMPLIVLSYTAGTSVGLLSILSVAIMAGYGATGYGVVFATVTAVSAVFFYWQALRLRPHKLDFDQGNGIVDRRSSEKP